MDKTYLALQREQLQWQVNHSLTGLPHMPKAGWIATVRKALGMTAATLGKRLGTTQPNIAALERSEREGRATIKSMREAAETMGCRFVYAFVTADGKPIESIVEAQAERKAREIVRDASVQMALENQQLDEERTQREVERLKRELMNEMPKDFWLD